MRFDTSRGQSAAELLRTAHEQELERVLREYGEEPASGRIAKWLVTRRTSQPITTGTELADGIMTCLGVARREFETGERNDAIR